jgi:predicted acylesterase/phospholipase RssA
MLRHLIMAAWMALGFTLQPLTLKSAAGLIHADICNVLALSGGGSFGAVQMGVLDVLIGSDLAPDRYDIITGISAGGLNAAFLSYSANVSAALPQIRAIYANLTTAQIYTNNIFHIFSTYGVYSTDPLATTLGRIIDGHVPIQSGPITLIGATNLVGQTLDVFRYDLATSAAERLDLLMSTSAIPIVFPPHQMNGLLYVDGGVISNEMIQQAVSQKSCSFYNFTFVSAASAATINRTIDGFFSYVSAVGALLLNTFDYQLAEYESVACSGSPRGLIQACFPVSPLLAQYSILDFDSGALLYDLGRAGFECVNYQFC